MNLINGLNEKKYTLQGLSEHYYAEIVGVVTKISRTGKLDEDTFNSYADKDQRLDHLSYDEFFEMTQLLKRYESAVHNRNDKFGYVGTSEENTWKNQITKLTNRALIRRLSQDMCEEDTKAIEGQNFLALKELGYNGKQDVAIPEIVRGNFNIYMRNKEKISDIKILKEAIDRSTLYLLKVDPRESISVQEYEIDVILTNKRSISGIREELAEKNRRPFESYSEKFLEDYHNEQFKNVARNLDVDNEKQKIQDKAMYDDMEVNEDTYKRLSELGYDGKTGHPLIKTGYRMYVDSYVYGKELDYCLDVSAELSSKLYNNYRAVAYWATLNSSTRKYVDPMSELIVDLSWRRAKSMHKKGKMNDENYEKMNDIVREVDIAMTDEKILTAIGNVKKSRAVAEKNLPNHSR